MGYLRGVSCAQRLALPMGLNGPFLSLHIYMYLYIYKACIATRVRSTVGTFGERNERERKRRTGNAGLSSAFAPRKAFTGGFSPPLGISPISLRS